MLKKRHTVTPIPPIFSFASYAIGNSVLTPAGHVQMGAFALYVTPDGTCWLNSPYEESGQQMQGWKNGVKIGNPTVAPGCGGYAVTGNSKFLFFSGNTSRAYPARINPGTGVIWNGVYRASLAGGLVAFPAQPQTRTVTAVDASHLTGLPAFTSADVGGYVRMPSGNSYYISTVTGGAAYLPSVGSDYPLHGSYTAGVGLGESWQGAFQTTNLTSAVVGLSCDDANVYVKHEDNSIVALDIHTMQPGTLPGSYPAPAGNVKTGADSAGNNYSIDSLGNRWSLVLTARDPSDTLLWQVACYAFIDTPDLAGESNGTLTLSSCNDDFSFVASNGAWSHLANTLNLMAYPNDPQPHFDYSEMQLATVSGHKLACKFGNAGNFSVCVLDGKGKWRPAVFFCGNQKPSGANNPSQWPPNIPVYSGPAHNGFIGDFFLSTDTGDILTGTASLNPIADQGGNISDVWLDSAGGIWKTNDGNYGIRYFPLQGFNGAGTPIYTYASSILYDKSVVTALGFTAIERAMFQVSTGIMVINGFTTARTSAGSPGGFPAGRVTVVVPNWKSNRIPSATIIHPWDTADLGPLSASIGHPKSMSFDGNRISMTYLQTSQTLIYGIDGSYIGNVIPPSTLWNGAYTDTVGGARLRKRPGGGYILIDQDETVGTVLVHEVVA